MSNIASLARTAEADARPTVIAVHCSGATRSEWRQLELALGHRFSLIAPDLIGSGGTAHWTGEHAFNLSDEAAHVVRIIDAANGPVHLVGHSYGGCVALRAAVERPTKVASMTLYEPVAMLVLKTIGPDGMAALKEITAIAGDISLFVQSGDHHTAAKRFFECWNGEGSWSAMRPEAQDDLVRYIPKVCLEFSAVLNERTPLAAYRRLNFPVLLLQGERAPDLTQLISRQLARAMRFASPQTVYGAGHMGPFSHATVVSAMIAEWIVCAQPRLPTGGGDIKPDIDRAA
jgi:pimeloyl-ACP methyl ester carboxylesterase